MAKERSLTYERCARLCPPLLFLFSPSLSFSSPPSLSLFNIVASFIQAEKVPTPAVRHISAEVVPMGPPPPPKPKQSRDSTFMEKLHAVDEELASSPVCMDSFQVSSGGLSLVTSDGVT